MISIRRALLKYLLAALLLCTFIVGIFTYLGAQDEVNELFDNQLRQMAFTIQRQEDEMAGPRQDGNHAPADTTRTRVKGEKEFLIQIWNGGGSLIYSSHPAIDMPGKKKRGISTVDFQGESWRVFCLPREKDIVQVSQPLAGRNTIIGEIALNMLVPALLQFPILAVFGWIAVRRSLKPLKAVSSEIGQRSAAVMAPVDIGQVPEEIQPLGQALNALLGRLDQAMKQQRQFTSGAAHELRTPLAAIQLQMELLQRAKTGPERTESLQKLSQGVERAIHLVQQLLTFARVDPQERRFSPVPVRLDTIVREAAGQFAPLAHRKNIDFGIERCVEARIEGEPEKLQILVNNLIDNAIRYTQDGGHINLALFPEDGRAVLEVSDNGPGIPEAERERVFDRFYRITGTKAQGTGLGLAIVRTIAEQHGATVTLHEGIGKKGIAVKVTFPRAA